MSSKDNYKHLSVIDIWTIHEPYNVFDNMGLPLLPKSFLRHHMQQYSYLVNVTRQRCHTSSGTYHIRDSYIYIHIYIDLSFFYSEYLDEEKCEELIEKFSLHEKNYKKAMRFTTQLLALLIFFIFNCDSYRLYGDVVSLTHQNISKMRIFDKSFIF